MEPATESDQPSWARRVDERVGTVFWLALLGVAASVAGAIVASLARIDPTQIEAGLLGAFLGSGPVILMPFGARLTFGADSAFTKRDRLPFRALTLLFGVLVSCSRFLGWWPHRAGHVSSVIATAGLVAAILASWFWPHLPQAARMWVRQQLPRPRS